MHDREAPEAPARDPLQPTRDPLRVLLIDGTASDEALIGAAVGPNLEITSASSFDEAAARGAEPHDVVVIGRACSELPAGAVLSMLEADDPHRPLLHLTDVSISAAPAVRDGLDGRGAAGGPNEPAGTPHEPAGTPYEPAGTPYDATGAPHEPAATPHAVAAAILASLARTARARAAQVLELRRTDAALRQSERRARFLISVADAARRLERPVEIAHTTLRLLREMLGADRCAYGDCDPDGGQFTYAAVDSAPGVPGIDERFAISGEDCRVLLEREPFVIDDSEAADLRTEDRMLLERNGVKALIMVPIMKDARVAAIAAVHMLCARRWTAEEVELVDVVAERLWESMELARVSRALKRREREYRDLFDLSAVGVAQSDPSTGRFVRANRRFCELTGYTEAELRGLTFTDVTHPEDRAANTAAIGKVLRGEATRWNIEKRYLRRDGSVVWAYVSGQVMTDAAGKLYGIIANAADITDRKLAESALIASRRQLELVSDSAPVMLANCGSDYRYKFVNRAYAERYGKTAQDFVGRTVAEVLGEETFANIKPHADRAIAGAPSEFEAEADHEDLGTRWIHGAYAPELDEAGRSVGWVAAIIDITDRKRAEQTLKEADRRKDEFLAVLGHELRNPLAPLRAGIELLHSAEQRPEMIAGLRAMMERQIGHLIHLVDDLLDLARVTRGGVQLRVAPLDLRDVIRAAVELCGPLVAERGHVLEVTVEPEALPVEGDFQRLTQVLGNILSNAAKYTEPGGRIEMRGAIEEGRVIVRVRDTGYGIPRDRLDYVFEMFGQVPEHLVKTGGGGIGIGLALARQLLTLHGGTIEARSEGLNRGSEFAVVLPLAVSARPRRAETAAAARRTEAKRLLVVDDNLDAAEALRMVLALEGHTVEVAHSGADALDAVRRFGPDVVLLDIGMPGMDGYEVAHRIRSTPHGDRIAIYALTGWAQEEDKRRALAAGFDDHLTKPVDQAALLRLIATGRGRGFRGLTSG